MIEIKAESLEEAVLIAEDSPLPTSGDYLEGSFQIDSEALEYMSI